MSWHAPAGALLGVVLATGAFEPPRFRSGAAPLPPAHAIGWGEVVLEVEVNEAGTVQAVQTLRTTPPYTDDVRAAVVGWRFDPAIADGRAVSSRVIVHAIFRPRGLHTGPALGSPPQDLTAASAGVPSPVSAPRPAYPPNVIGDGVSVVEVLVDSAGRVEDRRVVVSGGGFDRAALQTAGEWSFRPADRAGTPVAGRAYLIFGYREPVVLSPGRD